MPGLGRRIVRIRRHHPQHQPAHPGRPEPLGEHSRPGARLRLVIHRGVDVLGPLPRLQVGQRARAVAHLQHQHPAVGAFGEGAEPAGDPFGAAHGVGEQGEVAVDPGEVHRVPEDHLVRLVPVGAVGEEAAVLAADLPGEGVDLGPGVGLRRERLQLHAEGEDRGAGLLGDPRRAHQERGVGGPPGVSLGVAGEGDVPAPGAVLQVEVRDQHRGQAGGVGVEERSSGSGEIAPGGRADGGVLEVVHPALEQHRHGVHAEVLEALHRPARGAGAVAAPGIAHRPQVGAGHQRRQGHGGGRRGGAARVRFAPAEDQEDPQRGRRTEGHAAGLVADLSARWAAAWRGPDDPPGWPPRDGARALSSAPCA